MLDIKFIRENADTVQEAATAKGYTISIAELLKLDAARRKNQAAFEDLSRKKNEHAAGMAKGVKPSDEQLKVGKAIKVDLQEAEEMAKTADTLFTDLLKLVPNVYSTDTHVGTSEDDNKVVYEWGDRRDFKEEGFTPLNHWQLAEQKGWIDKERAAKVAGSRFAYISGPLVNLQLAIELYVVQLLSDKAGMQAILDSSDLQNVSSKPFVPVLPPHMIKTEVFEAMDRLEPREDRYKIEGEELWLQGSAEHVLGSRHINELIPYEDLPLRYLGYATSYRKEAGTYGKDMEGIIRMHQFDKLEMEILSKPEEGMNEHLLTIAVQEYLLRIFNIPYRKLLKCTADIGKPNYRGVDMDAWLPGQGKYRETHTADYMTDYQTRRLKTRTKDGNGKIVLVHTIDATAFALGRILVAIIENYQTPEGEVGVPEVLQPFMNGRKQL